MSTGLRSSGLSRQTAMAGSAGRLAARLLPLLALGLALALAVLACGCAAQSNPGTLPGADAQATTHRVHVVRHGWHSGIVVRPLTCPCRPGRRGASSPTPSISRSAGATGRITRHPIRRRGSACARCCGRPGHQHARTATFNEPRARHEKHGTTRSHQHLRRNAPRRAVHILVERLAHHRQIGHPRTLTYGFDRVAPRAFKSDAHAACPTRLEHKIPCFCRAVSFCLLAVLGGDHGGLRGEADPKVEWLDRMHGTQVRTVCSGHHGRARQHRVRSLAVADMHQHVPVVVHRAVPRGWSWQKGHRPCKRRRHASSPSRKHLVGQSSHAGARSLRCRRFWSASAFSP